jgi:hypothetical protein
MFFMAGVGFGNDKTAKRLDKYFTNVLLPSSAASELKAKITLLELLNSGDSATTQKRLENLVDADLGTLILYVNNPPLKQDDDVIEAIRIARKYRERHPNHRVNPAIENSVKKTLEFVD